MPSRRPDPNAPPRGSSISTRAGRETLHDLALATARAAWDHYRALADRAEADPSLADLRDAAMGVWALCDARANERNLEVSGEWRR